MVENGRAVGVRVGRKSGDVTVRAPRVISGAGLYNTFERLLPRHVASKSYYTDICSTLKVGSSSRMVEHMPNQCQPNLFTTRFV